MIKTDFSQAQSKEKEPYTFFSFPTILYGINFGVFGALSNSLLQINFFGNFGLYFGQIFVLFCLVTRGLNAAIVTATITSIFAATYADDPYLIVIFLLEMMFVHMSMRKGYFLFQSAMLFWLIIGMPLLVCLHFLTSFASFDYLFVMGVTRGLNGLICVSVVAICCWFFPSRLIYYKYYTNPPKLSSLIFSLCMLTVTLPAMVISLFFIWQSTTHNEKAIEQELLSVSTQAAKVIDIETKRHEDSLQTIATILETNASASLQPLIIATAKNYDLFESMILTDQFGKVLRAAPAKYTLKLNKLSSPSVNSRNYFQRAQSTQQAFITEPIVGKGLGRSFIVCFVTPIIRNGMFVGIVQGAMTLDKFNAFNRNVIPVEYSYVITDKLGRIMASSNDLNIPFLSNFSFKALSNPLITTISTLQIDKQEYLYQQSQTTQGWTITILQPISKVTSVLVDYFFMLILATVFVLCVFAMVAKTLSKRITRPLVNIAENFPNTALHPKIIRESQVSSEMVKLTRKLVDSHEVMSNFHQQLSEQVHNKTKQLKQLNRELYSIAQKDSLTQLLNRAGFNRLAITSYRNCVRSHISLSLIFLDIDHFKRINDTYGHPFGDKCIVSVAKTIQKHCKRDTDIIGRYGGEEFIIMIVGGEIAEHQARISLIKDEISKLRFKKDNDIVQMTISAGICSLQSDFSVDFEDLLQLSDNQLYISKREGRDKISSIIR